MQKTVLALLFIVISNKSYGLTKAEFCKKMTTKTYQEKCKIELSSIEYVDSTALKNCFLINGKDQEKIKCLGHIANKTFAKSELARCSKYLEGYLAEYTGLCFKDLGQDYQNGTVEYKPMETVAFSFDIPLGPKAMCNSLPSQMCKGDCFINKDGVCSAHY